MHQHMTKKYLLFLVFITISIISCNTAKLMVDGKTAYNSMQYAVAADLLQKELSALKTTEEKYDKTLMIARSYKFNNQPSEAVKWFEKNIDIKENSDIIFEYALELKRNEDYAKAIVVFEKLMGQDADYASECRRNIDVCKLALVWMSQAQSAKTVNIESINSPQSDYAALKMKDGSLIFTSDRTEALGTDRYKWTAEKYGDLFITNKTENGFSTPVTFPSIINTNFYEGTACFNKDNNIMYFTRCGSSGVKNDYCAIYKSLWDGNNWGEAEIQPLLSDTCNVGQPFLSKDGKTLFFSADFLGGFGGRDIYFAPINSDGTIGEPSNAGSSVNTEQDEMFPTLDENNSILYFSSNGLTGLGGLDIFKATKEKGIWKNVENMKYPINSGADDFYLILDKTKPANDQDTVLKSGYLTSARKNGKGMDDIYSYQLFLRNNFVLEVTVVAKKYANPEDPKSAVIGKELLSESKVTITAAKELAKLTDSKGLARFDIEKETDYNIDATKVGYLKKSTQVTTKGKRDANRTEIVIQVEIELEKIFSSQDIEISNIYYGLDSTQLRPESYPALYTLLSLFKHNPDLTIEIGSHTDARGSDAYNLKLSQGRAQSVVDYLIAKGIAPERLIAKGYGETKLLNDCGNGVKCTEEEHQRNRRTTFRVISQKVNIESTE
jgi:outer membrane protein OmpA-like peptidoglycan-associated protein/tetratricopeptide (TPR) repeat protein